MKTDFTPEELDAMRLDKANYKFGIYYNPKDPRVFLSKYYKWMGFTLNFAKPISYLILILTLVVTFLISYYLKS